MFVQAAEVIPGSVNLLLVIDGRKRRIVIITYSVNRITVNMIQCLCLGAVISVQGNTKQKKETEVSSRLTNFVLPITTVH